MGRKRIDEYIVREERKGITPKLLALEQQRETRLTSSAKLAKTKSDISNIKGIIPSRGVAKFALISVGLLLLIVGPALGVISQLTLYLSPTIIFWLLGLLTLILILRRR